MNITIGKYTLETLTVGMYDSPKDLYREYIQNSADSIDLAIEQGLLKQDGGLIDVYISNEKKEILVNWCKANFNAVKTINTQITSYDIKQTFSSLEDGFYVTNGQIKGAMVKAGFEMKTAKDGINSRFNVSKTSPYFKD